MADPFSYPETADDIRVGPDREPATSTPRWVKVFGIIALLLVLLFVVLILTGGHDPGRHTPSSDAGGLPAPSSVRVHGAQQR